MIGFLLRHWRLLLWTAVALAIFALCLLVISRGHRIDELQRDIATQAERITRLQAQTKLLAAARQEDQDRHDFKSRQFQKISGAAPSAPVAMPSGVRSAYDSLRERQARSGGDSR